MSAPLYSIEILRLAAAIPHHARLAAPQATVERRSATCGSRIVVDVVLGPDGRVAAFGQEVRACALGQAAAAILGAHVVGRSPAELTASADTLAQYLTGAREDPGEWPGVAVLAPAQPYSARHASIRLAFDAAAQAARQAAA